MPAQQYILAVKLILMSIFELYWGQPVFPWKYRMNRLKHCFTESQKTKTKQCMQKYAEQQEYNYKQQANVVNSVLPQQKMLQ